MKYKVKIGTPNKMFFIKGRIVRSPLEWVANKSELKDIHIKIASEGIADYSIIEFDPNKKIVPIEQKSPTIKKQTETKKVITQETEKKSTTILDKLLDENEKNMTGECDETNCNPSRE